MFQYNNGLVNELLHNVLGITSRPSFWLIGHNSFFALVIISIWRNWPFAFLCVMAGLQGIPRDLYEASAIDGAGIWQQIRTITMPSLRAVNQVLVLVLFLWTFNDFTTPFVLFGASAPSPADVISIHIYNASFITWNFGEGSAMSVLMLIFLLLVTAVYLIAHDPPEEERARRRGPNAPPPSFLWTRRIVLTLLAVVRAGAGVRDGQQLAQAAAGRDQHVPVDPVAADRGPVPSTSGTRCRWPVTSSTH